MSIISSSPTLKNLIIIANTAGSAEAGLCVSFGSPDLNNVAFRGNYLTDQSSGMGGGMLSDQGNPTLTNVLFSGNRAVYGGGFASYSGLPTLINATFSGNSADYGGAIYVNLDTTILTNAIIWGNSSAVWGAGATITNSIVQGGYTGTDNQDIDPQFVNPVPYTTLYSTTGDYHLQASSPAIDAGNNTLVIALTDLDGNLRIVDGDGDGVSTVDMGAFERQAYTLMVNKVGNGTVTIDPDQNAYGYSEEVTLTALGDSGWNFTSWSGDAVSTNNPLTLLMQKNTTITANFTQDSKLFLPLVVR